MLMSLSTLTTKQTFANISDEQILENVKQIHDETTDDQEEESDAEPEPIYVSRRQNIPDMVTLPHSPDPDPDPALCVLGLVYTMGQKTANKSSCYYIFLGSITKPL
ncbi:uncharacterized protein LOC121380671 [Gigantopelta aegis]|uniref:uncharacterized protein LOC121380671 n=1 Tax=Gigantopelta aegis TaxID=1735272 RepID=UPI001B88C8F8|nr:uncharacterized protein LOC121380671 [Gigantopelta aegis]